jgi:glutathione peroxidase
MTGRQKILSIVYPFWMVVTKLFGLNTKVLHNKSGAQPIQSIYDLPITLNNGQPFSLSAAKGKKLLIVNTASDCGYTPQYTDLQQLHEQYGDKLFVIGFPANDFKEQEAGSDADIAQFCQVNFGVTFPLAKKSSVVKGAQQHPLFHWLSHAVQNGWNNQAPGWNFSKYLINEQGVLTHYFDSSISPLSTEVTKAINEK